jgi:DNA (cytosine-5)-methyltransferase 1
MPRNAVKLTPDVSPPLPKPPPVTKTSPALGGHSNPPADIEPDAPPAPKLKTILVADLFCGAGGSSTGARRALRSLHLRMNLVCVNHWPTAIDTHTRNHPDARHYCQDVNTVRPHLAVPEGRLDLLMASPTCTFHSRARGGKPTSDQQRMDPWHIITWLTELRVKRLVVENVSEFLRWGPVNARTGKPIKSREGEYFLRWVETIRSLGFEVDFRILNCANYGDATTRERFFLIARSDKGRLRWPDATHAPRQSIEQPAGLLGPALKPWRPAREVIDWNIAGRSIFNRPVPLSPRTLERILAGAIKLKWPALYIVAIEACALISSLKWAIDRAERAIATGAKGADLKRAQKMLDYARPRLAQLRRKHLDATPVQMPDEGDAMTVVLRNHMDGQPVTEPLPTVTAGGTHVGIAQPMLFQVNQGEGRNRNIRSVDDPVPTVMTRPSLGVAEPMLLATGSSGAARSTDEPMATITTGGAGSPDPGCARPMLLTVAHGNLAREKSPDARRAKSVDEPLGSITAGGGQFALVMRADQQGGNGLNVRSADEPLHAVTTNGGMAVVEPMVLNRHGDNGATRSHSIDEPLPTADCRGAGYLVEPMLGGNRTNHVPKDIGEPVGSPTGSTGDRFFLVEPTTMILSGHAGGAAREVHEPMPGMTAKANGPFLVSTRQHTGGPAPRSTDEPVPTLTATDSRIAIITPYYGEGSGKTGQAVTEPIPTITTKGRFGLVVPVTNSGGGPEPRSTEEPLPTMTTAKGGEFAMVTPVTHHDDSSRARSPEEPLPTITCAPRGDLAFIAASFGERDGQQPRVHTLEQPMPTLCAEGRIQLVQPGIEFDVEFRMLEPHELASAMGFNSEDQRYEFSGTKTDVIKQIGNAVPCNTAAALVRALFQ